MYLTAGLLFVTFVMFTSVVPPCNSVGDVLEVNYPLEAVAMPWACVPARSIKTLHAGALTDRSVIPIRSVSPGRM